MLKTVLIATTMLTLAAGAVRAQDAIQAGQMIDGRLAVGDQTLTAGEYFDRFTFQARAGQRFTVRMTSADLDSYLIVRGPGDYVEQNDDDGNGGSDSALQVVAPADGAYTILATTYAANQVGRYRLELSGGGGGGSQQAASSGGSTLRPGQSANGRLAGGDNTLSSGEYADTWTFDVTRGQTYQLDLRASDFDPYLIVRGPGGLNEDNDDAPGGGRDSRIRFTAEGDGQVTVAATSFSAGETGAYTLALGGGGAQADLGDAGSVRLGQTLTGGLASGDPQLDSGEFINAYTFRGRQGQQLDLRLSSSAFDPYLAIVGPSSFGDRNDDDADGGTNSRLLVTLPEDGEYQIVATSYAAGESGAYQLAVLDGTGAAPTATAEAAVPVSERAAADGSIDIGQDVSGSLTAGDTTLDSGEYIDVYRFSGRRGQRVSAQLSSSAFDAYLMVRDPNGEVQANDDGENGTDSRLDMVLPADGEYQLMVTSYAAGETGTYRFALAQDDGRRGSVQQASVGGGQRVYAVMVGVSDYGGAANNLAWTDEDAAKLAESLREEGVLNNASVLLTNADATVDGVRSAIQRVGAQAGPDDVFLFFFSGHGSQGSAGGFSNMEPDGKTESIVLRDGEITDADMAQMFAGLNTRLSMLVLDSCFSGGFARNVVSRPGVMGMFSSEEDLTSAVASKFEAGGYLSLFIREALEGDADQDGDTVVTAGEMSTFLRRRFRAEVVDEESITMAGQRNYQNLVIDRGGVQPDDVVLRLRTTATGGL